MIIGGKEILPVFIIRHGRSGTTFTGKALSKHQDVYATIEEKKWFWPFSEVSFNPNDNMKKVPELIHRQKSHLRIKCDKPVWVDKTHPLVLLHEIVDEYYQEARLIHVLRNPFDVYCSVIRHKGVMSWFNRCDEVFGKGGNLFLGTDETIEKLYHLMKTCEKVAYRWRSWVECGLKWGEESENILTIHYEDMIENPSRTFTSLANFIGIKTLPAWLRWIDNIVQKGSVGRYKRDMDEAELDHMEKILHEFLNKHKPLRRYKVK